MAGLYRLAAPLLARLQPERAHRLTLWGLGLGLGPRSRADDDPVLASRLWDLDFANPIGLAAGFDKDAAVPARLLALGFGFVETGTLTPRPQAGNPRPRVFRLPEDRAVINRLGFNNAGQAAAAARLARLRRRAGPIGVNIGANRDSADPVADYVAGVQGLAGVADYFVVNVSSPNTPGLRDLQEKARLDGLLAAVLAARDAAAAGGRRVPVLVKLAPDLDDAALAAIAGVALARGIDGAVLTNTTVARPSGLRGRWRGEAGGLSGRPLFGPSTAVLGRFWDESGGRLPLIGVGGVASGADAYAKIRAGASLVQLYTALAYDGPALVGRVKQELAALLRRDGVKRVADAVGADRR